MFGYEDELQQEIEDLKTLLKKYIHYVKDCEGTDFIECPGLSEITFTDKEWDLLEKLSKTKLEK